MRCKSKTNDLRQKEQKEKRRQEIVQKTEMIKNNEELNQNQDLKNSKNDLQLKNYFEDQTLKQRIHISKQKDQMKKYYQKRYEKTENSEKKKRYERNKYSDSVKQEEKKTNQRKLYSFSPNKKKKCEKSKLVWSKKKLLNQSVTTTLETFRKHCKEFPDYVCCACNRLLFKKQVTKWRIEKYRSAKSMQIAKNILQKGSKSKWICVTSSRHIKIGNIPTQAVANKMQLSDIPNELKCLNVLERHLISPVIPFMKIITLPKSLQKGVHGPVVCVQSDTENAVSALPRMPDEGTLVKVKLKRKLAYKGHHLYHFVNPSKVRNALTCLKRINSIEIDSTKLDVNTDESGMLSEDTENQSCIEETNDTNISEEQNDIDESEVSDTSAPLFTCLQPVDLSQYLADNNTDGIINIAPGEGNKPIEVIKTEAKAFPVQFPDGKNTFDQNRLPNLTLKRYFNARLFCNDTRFSNDPEYIFFSQYASELHEILSSVSIAVRKSENSDKVTSGMIQNSESLKKILKADEGYRFLQSVRGSPPYWEKTTRNLCAMLRQRGLPTFFVTFSAADRRWPEIVASILQQQGKEITQDLDWTQYCNIINSNIVTATRMFDKRLHDFINDIILSDAHPIGEVDDIFGRIEFQARGWPHNHGLVWIKNAPIFNEASDEEVSAFIDKYICCTLPDTEDQELYDIVSNVQVHSKAHSKSCKKGGKDCRFNFPRPPSTYTFISKPSSEVAEETNMDIETAKTFLQVYLEVISALENEAVSCDDILNAANMTQTDLENALNLLAQKPSVILKRKPNECWVNAYNPTLLRAWNGNMDIQFVLDAYSCVMYILSYITKAERELGQLIKQAQKEARENNLDAVKELRKLGHVYITHREVSVMEAVYRVTGLKLQHCSRDVIWIPSDPGSTRITLPLKILQNLDPESEDIYMTNVKDRYLVRPANKDFNDMCLAQFASDYRVLPSARSADLGKAEDKNIFPLQDNKGYIVKRKHKSAIIRYPRFKKQKDPEKYYSNLLCLFLPHRSKNDLTNHSFVNLETYFNEGFVKLSDREIRVKTLVISNMSRFEKLSEELDSAWQDLEKLGPLEDAWSQVAPNTEEQRIEDFEELKNSEMQEEDAEADEIPELPHVAENHNASKLFKFEPSCEVLHKLMLEKLQSMNKRQQHIFKYIKKWCLNKVNGCNPAPFFINLSGGAGTGKSHLIKCIHYESTKLLRHICEDPDFPTVLLMSFTGTAAFNIGGQTIHSSLKINILKLPYQFLGEKDVNTLRVQLKNLQMIIIDEISMVSKPLLDYVDGRLRQIKGSDVPFGNISILAVGDFYQVPPIFGKEIFYVDMGKLPKDLWLHFHLYTLTEIMRQKDDKEFADMLNRLRVKSEKDEINANDDKTLRSRVVPYLTGYPEESVHIFAKNVSCAKHNKVMLDRLPGQTLDLQAVDFTIGKKNRTFKRTSPVANADCQLREMLSIKVGARVMLVVNIDVSDGLVNGAMGTVTLIHDGKKTHGLPDQMYVVFDNDKVGLQKRKKSGRILPNAPENAVLIEPATIKFKCKNIEISRYQFPLIISWACTIHKVQGQTFQNIVVSMDGIFNHGMAYVGLSRATSINGLYLLDYKPELIYANKDVEKAIATMPKLDVSEANLLEFIDKMSSLKIVHHNIQYLTAHIVDLRNNYEMKEADVICLSETWLKPHHNIDDFNLEGYCMVHSDRSVQGTVGLAFYVKNTLKYHTIPFDIKGFENLVLLVDGYPRTLVSLLYKHHGTPATIYNNYPIQLVNLANHVNAETIVVLGDFNDDYLNDKCVSKLEFEKFEFTQVIESATTTLGTLLDHIYVYNLRTDYKSGVITNYYSYHDPVFIAIFDKNECGTQQQQKEKKEETHSNKRNSSLDENDKKTLKSPDKKKQTPVNVPNEYGRQRLDENEEIRLNQRKSSLDRNEVR